MRGEARRAEGVPVRLSSEPEEALGVSVENFPLGRLVRDEPADLLELAESGCYRLVDVFKSKPHWRELIHSDNRGAYRLAIPPHL